MERTNTEFSLSEMDPTFMSVLAATACGGAALVLFMRYCNRQRMKVKIRKARSRRDASVQQAEQAVQQFSTTVRNTLCLAFPKDLQWLWQL